MFLPLAGTNYTATLVLPYGEDQSLEVALSGNGYVNSVSDEPNVLYEFALYDAYPNPFNSTTTISFGLYRAAPTRMAIYDLTGREIVTLVNDKLEARYYNAVWNAAEFPSGLYICRMEAGGFFSVKETCFGQVEFRVRDTSCSLFRVFSAA